MPSVGPLEFLIIGLIVLILVGIVVAVFLLIRRAVPTPDVAMDALRARLARGEIDEAEYRRLRSVLHGR